PPLATREQPYPAFRLLGQAHQLQDFRGRPGVRVVAREVLHHLADFQVPRVGRLLQDDADLGPPRPAGPLRVRTEYGHLAAGARPVTREDLHRRALARAVRPQQREDLTVGDL